jgi:hypothetical protein
MATYQDGINGPFKGKVGTVVSYQWRGIWVMRSVPKVSTKKRSLKQLANQQKMSVVLELLQRIIVFIRKGYHLEGEKNRMSAFNAAMSYNKKNAILGEYPNIKIDYENVRFAQGELEGPNDLEVERFDDRIEFTWNTELIDNGEPDDQAMILLLPKETDMEFGELSGAQRKEGNQSVFFEPETLKDYTYHVYFAFISDDRSLVSNSIYLGKI